MPSSFPGMDPYLERPGSWSGVHTRFIAVNGELLTRQVAPRFFVDSEDNVYILGLDDPARSFVRPDLYVTEGTCAENPVRLRGQIATPVTLGLPAATELRVPYLTVVDTRDHEMVAILEVLSPIYKTASSAGQREFLRKRDQMLRSSNHWLEIDLLWGGARPPGIPLHGDYDAVLHRADAPERLEAWFVSLREPLPTVEVPLRPGFQDVPLDLQEVVETVYDRYRYDAAIDYEAEAPPPPPHPADAEWARSRIDTWLAKR